MARTFEKIHTTYMDGDNVVGQQWVINVKDSEDNLLFSMNLNEDEATNDTFRLSKINQEVKDSGTGVLTVGEWDAIEDNTWTEVSEDAVVGTPDPDFEMPGADPE